MTEYSEKGLAASQIVLITIGIIVLAIVVWLLYTQLMSGSSAIDANKCTAEKIRLCTICKFGKGAVSEADYKAKCAAETSDQLKKFCNENSVNCENVLPK